MSLLTIIFGLAFVVTLGLLIRSLFRQAGIQDAIKEASDQADSQIKLWEEFGEHLEEGVALIDEHDDIVYCNQAFAALTEWTGRSSFHQPLGTILNLTDADSEAKKSLSEHKEKRAVVGKDGTRTKAYAAKRTLHKPAGYSVIILQDATVEDAEKELRHRLVNLSSFELRAPITAMKGYADMLLEGDAGKLPEKAVGYVKPILESTDKLLAIIDDMASVEALSSTRTQTKKAKVDIMEFLKRAQGKLAKTAKAADRKFQVAAGQVSATVEIDRDQIARLLSMLVNTAARTAETGGTVTVRVMETPQTVELRIENVGEPVPRENQANIFDYVGAQGLEEGIGFYVAKQIIENHRASVNVSSKSDGNVFVLALPKLAGSAKPATGPKGAESEQEAAEAAVADLSGDIKKKPRKA
jgi:signal transduction histidine kinase